MLSLDLLVTDLVMPDLTGDALVMAVRELGGERELPIVVFSSYVDTERAEALRVAGADVVVHKSAGLAPIAEAARSLLAGRLAPLSREAAPSTPVPLGRIGLSRVRL